MTGYLIVNRYFSTPKLLEQYDMLVKAFSKRGVQLILRRNDEFCLDVTGENLVGKPDFAIMWDKEIMLAKTLEMQGVRLFDSASSIEICDDKASMHLALAARGVKCP